MLLCKNCTIVIFKCFYHAYVEIHTWRSDTIELEEMPLQDVTSNMASFPNRGMVIANELSRSFQRSIEIGHPVDRSWELNLGAIESRWSGLHRLNTGRNRPHLSRKVDETEISTT